MTSEFVIEHVGERFVIRLTDPATIAHARANLRGQNQMFPAGPLRRGDGGFNAPWTWHLDPDQTRLVETAIEVCDGRASYVEAHQSEYPTYCPWGAELIAERRAAPAGRRPRQHRWVDSPRAAMVQSGHQFRTLLGATLQHF